jgi:hypothetical protein
MAGGKDHVRHDQTKGNARWIAYTERPFISDTWEHRKVYDRFTSPRRNSRIHKILIHQYADTKYSIWIDANLKLLIPPEEVVERYLKEHDIAVFAHPNRDCIYDEAMVCAKLGLDNTETIIEQAKTYEDAGYGKHRGLCECNFIVRRHTPKVEQFNNAWWSEYCRHSVRDQISFMYALDKVGLEPYVIQDQWNDMYLEAYRGDVLHAVPHLTPQPE